MSFFIAMSASAILLFLSFHGILPADLEIEAIERVRYVLGAIFVIASVAWLISIMSGAYRIWRSRSEAEVHYLENARRFLEQNNPDDAIFIINKYSESGNIPPDASLLLARSWAKRGNPSNAAAGFEAYLKDVPGDISVLREYLNMSRNSGSSERSLKVAESLLQYEPWDNENLVFLVNTAISTNNEEMIQKILDHTSSDKPSEENISRIVQRILEALPSELSGNILNSLYTLFRSWGQSKAALKALEGLDNDDLPIIKGRIALESGDISSAADCFAGYVLQDEIQDDMLISSIKRVIRGGDADELYSSLDTVQKSRAVDVVLAVERKDVASNLLEQTARSRDGKPSDWRRLINFKLDEGANDTAVDYTIGMFERFPEKLDSALEILREIQRKTLSPAAAKQIRRLEDFKQNHMGKLMELESDLKRGRLGDARLEELCRILFDSGALERCIVLSNKARRENPQNDWAYELLVKAYVQVEEYQDAVKLLKALALLRATEPDQVAADLFSGQESPVYKRFLAELMMDMGGTDRAVTQLESIISGGEGTAEEKLMLAEALYKAGDYTKCLELSATISDLPKERQIVNQLIKGMCLLKKGMNEAAMEMVKSVHFENMMSSTEKLLRMYELGKTLEEQSMMKEALRIYRLILLDNVNYRDVLDRIKSLETDSHLGATQIVQGLNPVLTERFKDIKLLGTGGMGRVYRAFDSKLKQTIALKVMSDDLLDNRKAVRRFLQRDGNALATLNHPNIVRVLDVVEEGVPHIVLEYVDGYNVRDLAEKSGGIPEPVLQRVVEGVSDALIYAHDMNVIHRDIKPANVMINSKAVIKVMDFGLAKLVGATTMTESGESFGTLYYMSPEQVRGRSVDGRSDLYSLCVMIYELISGKYPFGGDGPEQVLYNIFSTEAQALSDISSCSQSISKVVMKGLRRTPDDRYDSVRDFLADWKSALE